MAARRVYIQVRRWWPWRLGSIRHVATVTLAIVLTTGLVPSLGTAGASAEEPERVIVGFEDPEPTREAGETFDGYRVAFTSPKGSFVVVLAEDAQTAIEDLRGEPNVAYVERDRIGEAAGFTPNDPGWSSQYGPQQVDLPQTWDRLTGSSEIAVCVGDTGVRYTHEDLPSARWKGGYDYANSDDDPWDDHWHGTHVTGIAAAGLDNGEGIAGAGNLDRYHMKILDEEAIGWYSWWAAGMEACSEKGDVVISLSLGGTEPSSTLKRAARDAWQDGDLIVAAAHNDGPCTDCIRYPAAYEEVIAVTCTEEGESMCSFSSTGPEAELAAPGSEILSLHNDQDSAYAYAWGTSMSTPHVAGSAALLWSRTPSLSNAQVRTLLTDNAQDLGPSGHDNDYGYGELDVDDALPPFEPVNLETVSTGPDEVLISWDPPSDEGASPVREYRVYRGHVGDPMQLVGTTGEPVDSFRDTGAHLLQPQQYRYAVQAVNDAGGGPVSEVVCGGGSGASLTAPVEGVTRETCERGDDHDIPASIRVTTDTAGYDIIAASGTGEASGIYAASGTGQTDGDELAASGTGDATCEDSGCQAASLGGDADARAAAVSGLGSASCSQTLCPALAPLGHAEGGLALTSTGDASGGTVAVSATGDTDSVGVEVTGTGEADGLVAVSATGDAEGCAAVSATGSAEAECVVRGVPAEVSGCDTIRDATGTDAVCLSPGAASAGPGDVPELPTGLGPLWEASLAP